jgi:hypothetical protein
MRVLIHTRPRLSGLEDEVQRRLAAPLERRFDTSSMQLLLSITQHPKKLGQRFVCQAVLYVPFYPALCVSETVRDLRLGLDNLQHRLRRLLERYIDTKLVRSRFPKKYYATRRYEQSLYPEETQTETAPEETLSAEATEAS